MNRSELVKTLELIKPALAPNNNPVPIFQCFNFTDGAVSAYDDSLAIVGPFDGQETFAVHGNTLLGLLSASSAEEVSIALKGDTATLTMAKSVSRLPFQSEADFIFKEPEDKVLFKLELTQSVFEAISLCLETVSLDETQKALLGVTIEEKHLYSCNGDSITRTVLTKGVGKNRALIPTKFCEAVVRLWSSLDMVKGVLYFSSEWVHASFDTWAIYGRVLEIDDPIDFEALIKKSTKAKFPTQAVPAGLDEALARARVLADPESTKTTIGIEKGKMLLSTETFMGEIKDSLAFKGHPDVTANINASHLAKAIKHCDQIAVYENCAVLEKAPNVLMLISNMGE